jgi:hypothetical protein
MVSILPWRKYQFALESYQGILPQDRLGAEVREKIMEFCSPLKQYPAKKGTA